MRWLADPCYWMTGVVHGYCLPRHEKSEPGGSLPESASLHEAGAATMAATETTAATTTVAAATAAWRHEHPATAQRGGQEKGNQQSDSTQHG